MGIEGAAIFIGAILSLGFMIWGGFTKRRSIAVAVATLSIALLAVGCGFYAFSESHSLPWTFAYGVIAVFSSAVGVKHLMWKRSPKHELPIDQLS